MKRTIILFFFLSIIFSSCGKKYETNEAIELYRNNESEFISIFKMFSAQNEITSIDISRSPLDKGFTKFSIVLKKENPENSSLLNRIEINPDYSFNGKIEFGEEEMGLLKENGLNVDEVISGCKFLAKIECYGINIRSGMDMYGPNTVKFELNPYQGYYYNPTGEFKIEGRDYIELSENVYYYTEL